MNRTTLLWAALLLLPAWAQAVTCENNIPASNPDEIYIDHGNGTVTDTRTGLMWKQCLEGLSGANCATDSATFMDWTTALSTAKASTFASYDDWRLPNLKELRSLVEECRTSPAINDEIFPGTPFSLDTPFSVWSSSPSAVNSDDVWVVNFNFGEAATDTSTRGVRLVRAGQSFVPLPVLTDVDVSGSPASSSADFVGTSDKNGTGHWIVVAAGAAAPTSAQVRAGNSYGGVGIVAKADAAGTSMTAGTSANFGVDGFTLGTAYDFYLIAEADDGKLSSPPKKVSFTTATAHPITTTASPASGGTVSCSPNPVTQGGSSTCSATANEGYTFSAFSGDCTGANCSLSNVTEAKSVTATFTQNNHAIMAKASPVEGGSVSCTPNLVPHGSSSICSATANEGYTFSAFSGDCTGANCSLSNVTEAKSVTATFVQTPMVLILPEGPQVGQPLTVTLSPSGDWVLASASTQTLASLGNDLPPGLSAPHGLVNLQLRSGAAGSSATVVLTYPQPLPAGTRYYKYGQTHDDATPHWYEFGGAAISGNTITLTLTDGADGDDDLEVNSLIRDPGGPVVPDAAAPAPIPTLSQWAMVLLVGLLGVFGLGGLRRFVRLGEAGR